jgi:hypothetical protein
MKPLHPSWPLRAASLLIPLIAALPPLAGEEGDDHLVMRADSGFDSYDFSGRFMGQKIPNDRGGFDFFDAQGMFLGSSRSQAQGKIDFFDIAGNFVKTISSEPIGDITLGNPNVSKFSGLSANYITVQEFLYSLDQGP